MSDRDTTLSVVHTCANRLARLAEPGAAPSRHRVLPMARCSYRSHCVPLRLSGRCMFYHTEAERADARNVLGELGVSGSVCRHGFHSTCPLSIRSLRKKRDPCPYVHVEDLPDHPDVHDIMRAIRSRPAEWENAVGRQRRKRSTLPISRSTDGSSDEDLDSHSAAPGAHHATASSCSSSRAKRRASSKTLDMSSMDETIPPRAASSWRTVRQTAVHSARWALQEDDEPNVPVSLPNHLDESYIQPSWEPNGEPNGQAYGESHEEFCGELESEPYHESGGEPYGERYHQPCEDATPYDDVPSAPMWSYEPPLHDADDDADEADEPRKPLHSNWPEWNPPGMYPAPLPYTGYPPSYYYPVPCTVPLGAPYGWMNSPSFV